jgi:hypothetical protein
MLALLMFWCCPVGVAVEAVVTPTKQEAAEVLADS